MRTPYLVLTRETLANQIVRLSAENSHLEPGMIHEKALYYATFSTYDCKEGMSAFLEKRAPRFEHR